MSFTLNDEPESNPGELQRALKSLSASQQAPKLETLSIPDSIKKSSDINGKFHLLDDTLSSVKYVYVGRVNSCRADGCTADANALTANVSSEYFDYFMLVDSAFSVVLVRVFNYAASYGHQVTARRWLRQFAGYNGTTELVVGRNIDAISGATISANGITADITEKQALLTRLVE